MGISLPLCELQWLLTDLGYTDSHLLCVFCLVRCSCDGPLPGIIPQASLSQRITALARGVVLTLSCSELVSW